MQAQAPMQVDGQAPVNRSYYELKHEREAEWKGWELKISGEQNEIAQSITEKMVKDIFDYFKTCLANTTIQIPHEGSKASFKVTFSFRDPIEKSLFWSCLKEESVFYEILNKIESECVAVKEIESCGGKVKSIVVEEIAVDRPINCQPQFKTNFNRLNGLFNQVIQATEVALQAKLKERCGPNTLPLTYEISRTEDNGFTSKMSRTSSSLCYTLTVSCWLPDQGKSKGWW